MKRALVVASVASMIDQFNKPNINIMQDLGYQVDVATNFDNPANISAERCEELKQYLRDNNIGYYQIDFPRSPLKVVSLLKSFRQLNQVLEKGNYSICHSHSPVGGLVTRWDAKKYRKTGLKVIYTAHGFHFYKGAPLINWLIYYPIEKICSHWTDVLITINKEDYALAQKRMKAKRVEYVPGVGIDTNRFSRGINCENRDMLRNELGVGINEKMFLSVGELSARKNHKLAIEALSKLEDKNWKYFIVGKGNLKDQLSLLIKQFGLQNNVKLLGYRTDISDLCNAADLFIFPSLQEGLPVALMEAVASKTCVVTSDIRGSVELVKEKQLFNPTSVEGLCSCIKRYLAQELAETIEENYKNLSKFDIKVVNAEIHDLYNICVMGGAYKHLRMLVLRAMKRDELKVPRDAFLLLSVGELNKNKNHQIIVKALAKLNNPKIHYAIAGQGGLHDYLLSLAKKLGVEKQVHLLGYRTDVAELYKTADLYILPSKREGLNVSVMEAMSSGLPCLVSKTRGNVDLVDNSEKCLFVSEDVNDCKTKIMLFLSDTNSEFLTYSNVSKYRKDAINTFVKNLYYDVDKTRE